MNYYEQLKLEICCTQEDIKLAFNKVKKEYRPDINHNKGYVEEFKLKFEAFYFLSENNRREKYNNFLTKDNLSSTTFKLWRTNELKKLEKSSEEKTWGEILISGI